MANILKTEVKLNGVNVNSRLVNWNSPETFGQEIRDSAIKLSKKVYQDIPNLRNGHTISIKRGFITATDENVFDGYIDNIQKAGSYIIVQGRDKMLDLVKKSVTYSYDGISFPSTESKGSDIATDLIETWGGMTAEVVDTGTILILKKFICNGTDIFSRLQILAEIYDYQIRYDTDDSKVHFEPKGYNNNSTTIYAGGSNNNVAKIPKWSFDNTQCINLLTVKGATQDVRDTEYFSGDATSNQEFTLSKIPISVEMWYYTGGAWETTPRVPGVKDSTSGVYDYEIDKENKNCICTDDFTPANSVNNIRIEYVNSIPVPVNVEDITSQGKYGTYEGEKFFTDILTVTDAESRGNSWLNKYSEPFAATKVQLIGLIDYEAGNTVTIIDEHNDENRSIVINKITKKYPHKGDILELGDKEWKLAEWGNFTLERIRRLEEQNQQNTDLLIQIKTFPHTITFERRYNKLIRRGVETPSDVFVLNHIDYGVLGTNKLGDDGFGDYDTLAISWFNETYRETIMDDDFYDSINSSNVTWNDTLKKITLTYGNGIFESNLLFINTTYGTATATLGETDGDFKIYISADGKSTWQELEDGIPTSLSSSDATGVYLRVRNDGGGAPFPLAFPFTFGELYDGTTIENIYDDAERVETPAISLKMEE